MTMLNTEMFEDYPDIDLTHKINAMELDNWINHLKHIRRELNNIIGICKKELNNKLDDFEIVERFQKKMVENENLIKALLKYVDSRVNIVECEDIHCDMGYFRKHESFRKSYLYHLDKYRRLKAEFFNKA